MYTNYFNTVSYVSLQNMLQTVLKYCQHIYPKKVRFCYPAVSSEVKWLKPHTLKVSSGGCVAVSTVNSVQI